MNLEIPLLYVFVSSGMHATQQEYLDGPKALWIEQKNPYWVWVAVKTSIRNNDSLPDWVCKYLEEVADHLLSPDAASGDFARKLPRILGFHTKSGPNHPLKIRARMLRNEEFAMRFAKHILMGKTPKNARNDAANESGQYWQDADDKSLQTALREHFKLNRAPVSTPSWQSIVIRWIFDNPLALARYRDLPPLNELFEKLAAISRDSSVS